MLSKWFVRSTITTYGASSLNLVFSLLGPLVAARVLGPAGWGQVTLVLLVTTTLISLGGLSVRQSTIYALASNRYSVSQVFSSVLMIALVLGFLLLGIAHVAFIMLRHSVLTGLEPGPYYMLVSVLPMWLLLRYMIHMFAGLKRIIAFNVFTVLEAGSYAVLLLVLFLSLSGTVSVAVTARAVSIVLVVPLAIATLLVQERGKLRFVLERQVVLSLLGEGLRFHLVSCLSALNRNITTFVVNGLLGNAETGLYSVALRLVWMILIFPNAVATILFPTISNMSKEEANQTTPIASRVSLIVTIAMAVALAAVAKPLIPLVFGAGFAPAITPLIILLPGVAIWGVQGLLLADLQGRGRPLLGVYSRAASGILMVAFGLALIPFLGLAGAALAVSLSWLVGTIVMIAIFTKNTGTAWSTLVIPQVNDFRLLALGLKRILRSARTHDGRLASPADS